METTRETPHTNILNMLGSVMDDVTSIQSEVTRILKNKGSKNRLSDLLKYAILVFHV